MLNDQLYDEQLQELADAARVNGRLAMANEVLAWSKKHERGISDMAMTDLLRVLAPKA